MTKRERLALIVVTLALEGRMTGEELAGVVDAPESTVYSDVRTLRRSGIPIRGVPGQGGGFSVRPEFAEENLRVHHRDIILLLLATGTLLSRAPTPAGAGVMRGAMENVLGLLPPSASGLWHEIWLRRFAPPEDADVSLYIDLPQLLTHAILGKLTLVFEMEDGSTVTAIPEAVQWDSRGWWLVARDLGTGEKVDVELERVRAARLV